MNNEILTRVALRYRAVFLDINREDINMRSEASVPVLAFTKRLKENGFCVSEELLHALNAVPADRLAEITECINDVMGVKLNWASLVKGWNVPTDETLADHLITFIANFFGKEAGFKGTTLPCGHLIPEGTFPIERYNGCPFCGTPFETADFVYKGQGSKLKELRLFTISDMKHVFTSLLASSTPLDATQKDSLEQLLREFPIPEDANITMKETATLVIKLLVEQDKAGEAAKLLKTPTDILRYLWYEKTGYVQIIEPKTLVAHARKLYYHMWGPLDRGVDAAKDMKKKLMLKYDHRACLRVALWLNAIPLTAKQAAENMNPKRGMWVRMIRALRLGEYSRKNGFDHLAEILDVFYKQEYSTWQGRVDRARSENDADMTLALLKERPGLFARCLFASMLRFGSDKVIVAFEEIADKLPARLLLSLGNAAETYFDPKEVRLARPITGVTHKIEPNKLLALYDDDARKAMVDAVDGLYKASMARRFAAQGTEAKTIFIDSSLYNIPVSVGDRSTTIQDTSCALMGTRFPVEDDAVRLFLQWGKGLHAQHLDMDLSARIALANGKVSECAYYSLRCVGAKHSGDIRSIPEMVGTAEYIELSLPELENAGAKYVTFTCNAYSVGALSPNLVVGWMDSANPMKISEKKGVAYDPSCVQHMVRISEGNLSKGLVFGVLDVAKHEIIWLEMPFTSQTLRGANSEAIEALLHKLEAKLSIGQLLDMKAKAQNLIVVENVEDADEAYTYEWALNPADVTKLLNG
ncbi:hypothetical protein [Xylanibacter ruminicola]|uniref:Prokaryotic RING finger family 4 n=1 Tax=Xylanibacter ruminicola TaxID=839 RepID=A0A1M6SF35_XYLRU|nr:hypothetical protein [Xylanibacter ruminicola]SHK43108.1 hypothetical protein SAMN05216463_103147 [Xylanibacter ruminicola]